METWKVISVFAILACLSLSMAFAYTDSDNVEATVTVPLTCIVSLDTNSISFGSIADGTNTGATNQMVNITNSGTGAATNTTLTGEDWSDGGTNSFGVGNTKYGESDVTYASLTGTLSTTPTALASGALAKDASLPVYFGVAVPADQAAATYNQTITVTMNC